MASVEILSGRSSGTVVELGFDGRWQVGTARTAEVRLRERGVSYAHATICADEGRFCVVDQHSSQGTFVNGERVAKGGDFALASGDEIRFGSVQVRFVDEIPAERSASARIQSLAAMNDELTRSDDLRDRLAEAEEELSRSVEETAVLRGKLARAEVERDAARAEAAQYEEEVGRLRAKLEETCASRDARISELEGGLSGLEAKLERAESSEIERLQAELIGARSEAEEFRSQVDEINQEMIELQDELETARGHP
jgi:pSer/pThr/pTyr-binding forkhead associated (FHA) protein